MEKICGMDVDEATNDVYFVGFTRNLISTPNTYNLVYWKNDVKYNVASYSFAPYPYERLGIKFFNNNTYICGSEDAHG